VAISLLPWRLSCSDASALIGFYLFFRACLHAGVWVEFRGADIAQPTDALQDSFGLGSVVASASVETPGNRPTASAASYLEDFASLNHDGLPTATEFKASAPSYTL
jgi:hypothetical protein